MALAPAAWPRCSTGCVRDGGAACPGAAPTLRSVLGVAGDMTVAAAGRRRGAGEDRTRCHSRGRLKELKVGFERRKRGAFVGLGFIVDFRGRGRSAAMIKGVTTMAMRTNTAYARPQGMRTNHSHDTATSIANYAQIRRLLRRAGLMRRREVGRGHLRAHRGGRGGAAWDDGGQGGVSRGRGLGLHRRHRGRGGGACLACARGHHVFAAGAGDGDDSHGARLMPVASARDHRALARDPSPCRRHGRADHATGAAILPPSWQSFGPPPPMLLCAQGLAPVRANTPTGRTCCA